MGKKEHHVHHHLPKSANILIIVLAVVIGLAGLKLLFAGGVNNVVGQATHAGDIVNPYEEEYMYQDGLRCGVSCLADRPCRPTGERNCLEEICEIMDNGIYKLSGCNPKSSTVIPLVYLNGAQVTTSDQYKRKKKLELIQCQQGNTEISLDYWKAGGKGELCEAAATDACCTPQGELDEGEDELEVARSQECGLIQGGPGGVGQCGGSCPDEDDFCAPFSGGCQCSDGDMHGGPDPGLADNGLVGLEFIATDGSTVEPPINYYELPGTSEGKEAQPEPSPMVQCDGDSGVMIMDVGSNLVACPNLNEFDTWIESNNYFDDYSCTSPDVFWSSPTDAGTLCKQNNALKNVCQSMDDIVNDLITLVRTKGFAISEDKDDFCNPGEIIKECRKNTQYPLSSIEVEIPVNYLVKTVRKEYLFDFFLNIGNEDQQVKEGVIYMYDPLGYIMGVELFDDSKVSETLDIVISEARDRWEDEEGHAIPIMLEIYGEEYLVISNLANELRKEINKELNYHDANVDIVEAPEGGWAIIQINTKGKITANWVAEKVNRKLEQRPDIFCDYLITYD